MSFKVPESGNAKSGGACGAVIGNKLGPLDLDRLLGDQDIRPHPVFNVLDEAPQNRKSCPAYRNQPADCRDDGSGKITGSE